MKMRSIYFFRFIMLLVPALSFSLTLSAQEALKIIASAQVDANGDVLIRWAPSDVEGWDQGNTGGYYVHRMTAKDDQGNEYGIAQRMNSGVWLIQELKSLPPSEWETWMEQDDMAGIAAGAIYGENVTVEGKDTTFLSYLYGTTKEEENKYGFGLTAADHDFDIACAMGLGLRDETAVMGYTYLYTIGYANAGVPAESRVIEIEVAQPVPPPSTPIAP